MTHINRVRKSLFVLLPALNCAHCGKTIFAMFTPGPALDITARAAPGFAATAVGLCL